MHMFHACVVYKCIIPLHHTSYTCITHFVIRVHHTCASYIRIMCIMHVHHTDDSNIYIFIVTHPTYTLYVCIIHVYHQHASYYICLIHMVHTYTSYIRTMHMQQHIVSTPTDLKTNLCLMHVYDAYECCTWMMQLYAHGS